MEYLFKGLPDPDNPGSFGAMCVKFKVDFPRHVAGCRARAALLCSFIVMAGCGCGAVFLRCNGWVWMWVLRCCRATGV